ncbi:uncharacterized protein LOC119096691 [Pollicipes pollicipes]|uniref:uncharacterized protein LOC119096691 n=1 Tax=Pollicipes pollicipes TaxID=41117 RepID=UPI0018852EEC|nr:uncharacterized protein LOC119096691 [Pollicipes pollicipes]
MMPDVVGRAEPQPKPEREPEPEPEQEPRPGPVTITVGWEPSVASQPSDRPASPERPKGGETRGEADSPPPAGLETPLADSRPGDGEAAGTPATAGAAAAGMRRAVRWGDDVGDLPARLEGVVETSRDPRAMRWCRQHLAIRGQTLLTPDLKMELAELKVQPAPETGQKHAIKLCRGNIVELLLKFRSRDEYKHWFTMLKNESTRPTDDVSRDVTSDVTETSPADTVSVSYGGSNTVSISYGSSNGPEPAVSDSGNIEFESWVVAGETDEATVHLGEEPFSDVSGDQTISRPLSPSPDQHLDAGANGTNGLALSLDDLRSQSPPPAFSDRPHRPASVRWDQEMSSPDLESRAPAPPSTELGVFGLRRAGSEWTLAGGGGQTASIRSERIRRAAHMFEEIAQAERAAALRCVDAIVALGAPESDDSDRDEENEELLWLKVKAKIAERRRKFHQLDQSAGGPPSPADPDGLDAGGDGSDPLRCWTGKYIEQDEEQEVLRGLGNPVLAEQKLLAKQKSRDRLQAGRQETEQHCHRIQTERDLTQTKLDQVKSKLTRDSAFERKRLETVLFRLDRSLREEQQKLGQLTHRIQETDDDIEQLGRRLSHLAAEPDNSASPLLSLE